jgi:hypothetical protein
MGAKGIYAMRFAPMCLRVSIEAVEQQHAPAMDRPRLSAYSALLVARFHLAEALPASVTSDFCAA